MAITLSTCDSFWQECLKGIHADTDTYKLAIFARDATAGRLGKNTTAYAATVNGAPEITGTNYSPGGIQLAKTAGGAGADVVLDSGAHKIGYDWAHAVFSNVTLAGLKANGFYALIYNSTKANRAVAVGEWAANDLANDPTAADFTVTLPSAGTMVVYVQN